LRDTHDADDVAAAQDGDGEEQETRVELLAPAHEPHALAAQRARDLRPGRVRVRRRRETGRVGNEGPALVGDDDAPAELAAVLANRGRQRPARVRRDERLAERRRDHLRLPTESRLEVAARAALDAQRQRDRKRNERQ
jgi:hypothetical protein